MTPWLLVSGDFVPTGGMDAANLALADHLAGRGHPLHLVAHRVSSRLAGRNVTVHRVPRPLRSYLLGAPLLQRRAARIARQIAPHGGITLANGGSFRDGRVNWLHYVHAAHEPHMSGSPWRRALAAWGRRGHLEDERIAIARARVVIANSERTRTDAITLLNAAPERVHTVYYGTDPAVFRPPTPAERAAARQRLDLRDDEPLVLFVGALGDRRKGFDTLFGAWQRLRSSGWNARLIAVGGGQEVPAWRARANAAGLDRLVQLPGFTQDVRSLLWAADLLAAPSRYEAYGLAAHEALCCGVPVITTLDAGVAERIDGPLRSLLLDHVEDPEALDGTLRRWLDDSPRFRDAAALTGARLRSRSWMDMAARIVEIVEHDDDR